MDNKRKSLYKEIEKTIGQTNLYEIHNLSIPNGNRIFCKEEWTNPSGSHYDRVYLRLFNKFENENKIVPGVTHLVETTSGNAGVSFSRLANLLGFKTTVIIPEDMPKTRIFEMRKQGTELIFSNAGEYVQGVVKKLREYLIKYNDSHENKVFCIDHSRRKTSYKALYSIAEEIEISLQYKNLIPHYFIGAIGNGTTTAGIYNYFKNTNSSIKMIGVEPIESPVFFTKKFPGRFENTYGYQPEFKPHNLIGAGGWGVKFPNVQLQTFNDIILCKEPEWQKYVDLLQYEEKKPVGRTSAACLNAAMKLAENVRDKIIFILFYDPLWKYQNIYNGQ